MKTISMFPRICIPILFAGCLIVILLGGGITVSAPNWSPAGQAAFAGEPPPGGAAPASGKTPADGEKPCKEKPPVVCTGMDVTQNPVPGA